ncbi:MAG TPA: sigma factor, partial [Puia sp.]|nr:sigma factor [Puia sp.]
MNQQKPGNILRLFNQGDRSAFTAIYNSYSNRVFLYAKYLLNSSVEAEDIVSDTFLKLWHVKARFRTQDKISAFLVITTRNACYDR